jgi:flavin reductase (DIM6/NTAB) family NADH-FMN oxidoreductase RutF
VILDPSLMDWKEAYRIANGSVLPRPIAFVSTISSNGVPNLAPFSFFTVVAANPLTLAFCPMRRDGDGAKKDTLVNIEATGEFVINIVSESFIKQMNETSAPFPPEVDEFEVSGLTPLPSAVVAAPRVGEAQVAYECKLQQIVEVGGGNPGAGALVLGTVERIHVSFDVLRDGRIDVDALRPVGRLGGADYTRCTDRFTLVRPGTR